MNAESIITGIAIGALCAIAYVPVMWIMWRYQQKQLGTIKCQRCQHVGTAKGLWRSWRGIKPVCASCDSEDWVKADSDHDA